MRRVLGPALEERRLVSVATYCTYRVTPTTYILAVVPLSLVWMSITQTRHAYRALVSYSNVLREAREDEAQSQMATGIRAMYLLDLGLLCV